MYDYIKGKLTKITAKYIVIEAGGLGYIVNVANPYSFSDLVNQEVQIYLHQVIREDAQLLFGFHTEDEKAVFLNLISVSGIGPTTALAIIAVDDNEGLVNAIDTSDIKYLMKFPKIGKKTAQQMVLDLAGKFVDVSVENGKELTNFLELCSFIAKCQKSFHSFLKLLVCSCFCLRSFAIFHRNIDKFSC